MPLAIFRRFFLVTHFFFIEQNLERWGAVGWGEEKDSVFKREYKFEQEYDFCIFLFISLKMFAHMYERIRTIFFSFLDIWLTSKVKESLF